MRGQAGRRSDSLAAGRGWRPRLGCGLAPGPAATLQGLLSRVTSNFRFQRTDFLLSTPKCLSDHFQGNLSHLRGREIRKQSNTSGVNEE